MQCYGVNLQVDRDRAARISCCSLGSPAASIGGLDGPLRSPTRHAVVVGIEDIPVQYEFTASSDTARRMSRAFLLRVWRRHGAVRVLALFAVVTVVLLYPSDVPGWRDRLVTACFWAAVVTLGAVAALAALSYRMNRRNLGRTTQAGAVMRTGFGEDEFITENELSSSRFSYDAVQSISSVSGFVFVQYVGQPVVRIYPAELFPAEVVEGLGTATARSSSGLRVPWTWLIVGVCMALVLADLRVHDDDPPFCSDLHRIDDPVTALRQAKASGDFDEVPALVVALRDAYQSIDPPPEIRGDWATAIEYFEFLERSARAVQQQGRTLDASPQDDARSSDAMTNITDFAVEACSNRRRSLLVP